MSNTAQSLASTRIASLLDENSFVEIGGQVTARSTDFNMAGMETPSDGVITGYGVINGSLVYVYSQDASVMGGTIGEMHAKKIARLYEFAQKTGAPVIGLVDCAGMRLQEATDALNGFGEIYMAQAMASGVIPQITAVFGTCGGGMALIPAMTDFTFMESKNGKLFVNSPNALDGNHVSKCDTASADFQGEEAGLVDFAGTEEEILGQIRNLVSMLPANNEDEAYTECEDDLNRACADLANCAGDTGILLSQLSDNGIYFETKAAYGKDVVTAFIQLNGATVGAVANRSEIYGEDGTVKEKMDGTLSARGAKKAADFVKFCDAFNIPLVTLVDVPGFLPGRVQEYGGIITHGAKLMFAYGEATVPKVTVTLRKSYGGAHDVMSCKQLRGDFNYAWPTAQIAVMGAKGAIEVLYGKEVAAITDPEAKAKFIAEKEEEYNHAFANPYKAASYGYIDDVIEPRNTRFRVIRAFQSLQTKRVTNPMKKHSNIPL